MKPKIILWIILWLVIGSIVAAILYKSWPILFPHASVEAELDPDCNLRSGPCLTIFPDGGKATFSINPQSIPVMKKLDLLVITEGLDVNSVEVDFSGTDMYMGFNRIKLKKISTVNFSGEGIIPVCARDAMEWEAKVMMKTSNGLYIAPYRFITVKPNN